jgi:hypothetical protein
MDLTWVEVEIEELVLHGFGHGDGTAVAASLERALRSRLVAGGGFGESRTLDRVEAAPIRVGAGASPRALGRAVAERLEGSVRP